MSPVAALAASIVRLGNVAKFVRGISFKPDDVVALEATASVGCMRTKNVQTTLDLADVWGIPEALVKRSDQFLQPGDILVSTANSWNLVGKCCWVPALPWRGTFGGFIAVLRGDAERVDPRYLFHWFSSPPIQAQVRSFGQQTTNISNLNTERCLNLPVPLPPMSGQRQIVEILDKADALRAKRRVALEQLDTLTQAIFIDMFGDPVTNPMGWSDATTLGGVAEIVSGVTKGRQLTHKKHRTVPYLAVSNVHDRELDMSVVKSIDATEQEIERYALRRNDLLLTEGGDPDKLGRGTLWRDELPECIHQNHVFRVRLTSSAVDPVYLNWLVGSSRGKRYFLKSAKQTTGIASINMTQLRGFPLLIPPLPRQEEFAQIAGRVIANEDAHRSSLAELDALFASLQHRAFRGEL